MSNKLPLILFLLAIPAVLCSGYAVLYYGWIGSSTDNAIMIAEARYYGSLYSALLVISLLIKVLSFICVIREPAPKYHEDESSINEIGGHK